MNRWIAGAAFVAAGGLPLYPLQASAQYDDTASLKCEITDKGSVAIIENKNKEKKSSICRWRCTYQINPGGTHINEGAKKMRSGEKKAIKKAGKNIQHVVGMAYNCP